MCDPVTAFTGVVVETPTIPAITPTPDLNPPTPVSSVWTEMTSLTDEDPIPQEGWPVDSFQTDDGGFFGWLGHQLASGLDWLFLGHSFSNFFFVYLAIVGLVLVIKYSNRSDALKAAEKELRVLARLGEIDPDLVEEARVEVAFPHLMGRVSVEDFDEDLFDDEFDETMRAEFI